MSLPRDIVEMTNANNATPRNVTNLLLPTIARKYKINQYNASHSYTLLIR